MRPYHRTGARKDLATDACCGNSRSRPAPDRLRAPAERPRSHQGEGLRYDECFEAKQLTHGAYERLRTRQADKFEQLVLEAFQKKVTADVPVPPGADGISDYPERRSDAR